MVLDEKLAKAVSVIAQRSERQPDLQKLVGAFVDVGILPQISNPNNQIIYGRRGTGKTHVLRVLGSELESSRSAVVYIDARTLGSTSQFSDATVAFPTRCTALFRDVLGEIHNVLLEFLMTIPANKDTNLALEELDNFASVITNPVTTLALESTTDKERRSSSASGKAELSIGIAPLQSHLAVGRTREKSVEHESSKDYAAHTIDKLIFPAVSSSLRAILTQCKTQLYIMVDEWSSLPVDIQPYLAEFFKRSFIPLPQVTVKIGSLEHRSSFRADGPLGPVGFELGADIAAGIDIDDYYVFDRDPESITATFGDMLFRHLRNELPEDYLKDTYDVDNGRDLASKLFSERAVFKELVRASEGVARDLINIFTLAFFSAKRKGRSKIERAVVIDAARQWFEQDKEGTLDNTLREVLRRIIDEVIGKRKARSFLLPRALGDHPIVQKLFDLRVLHLVQRGYADKDKPGVRYNIYSLDYGTYVDLLNTSKRPIDAVTLPEHEADDEFIVPFDDKRSIRRIILSSDILDQPSRALPAQSAAQPDRGPTSA
jgi:hypothetical protein